MRIQRNCNILRGGGTFAVSEPIYIFYSVNTKRLSKNLLLVAFHFSGIDKKNASKMMTHNFNRFTKTCEILGILKYSPVLGTSRNHFGKGQNLEKLWLKSIGTVRSKIKGC